MDTTELAAQVVGSGAASEELFERVMGRIQFYFQRLIRDEQEVEDCLQDTVLLLQTSLNKRTYEQGRSFNVWMWLKARSVYGKWCRRRERKMEPLFSDVAVAPPTRGDVDRQLDAEALLNIVLEKLGPEAHEAFLLYYEAELTREEIAEVLGTYRKAVSKMITEAHALIDKLLEQE